MHNPKFPDAEYVVTFPAKWGEPAKHYIGPSFVGPKRTRRDDRCKQGPMKDAQRYTEKAAYALIASNADVFHDCTVSRCL